MGLLRTALIIARNDLRLRLRNRSFVLQAFVGPLVLAAIISSAFGGGVSFGVEIGIVDEDGGDVGGQVLAGLEDVNELGITFESWGDADGARQAVEDGNLASAIVIPRGFQESLAEREPLPLEVIAEEDDPWHDLGASIARSVAEGIAGRANASRLAGFASAQAGVPVDVGALTGIELPVQLEQRSSGDEVSPAAHFGPGMGLLFLFLCLGLVARSVVIERRTKVLDRVRVAPVPAAAILLGKALPVIAISVASLCTIWGATTLLLGADWGEPAAVLLLIVAAALSVAGLAMVLAAWVRTEQAAGLMASFFAFMLSLVGGNMLPLADMPDLLQRGARLTPNGWALLGFAELSAGDGGVADILPHVAILVGFAVVLGVAGAALVPRRLLSR